MFRKPFLISLVLFFLFPAVAIGNIKSKESEAPFVKGFTSYVLKDINSAIKYWRPLAKTGHNDAQYLLGVMYANGQGVKLDFQKAAFWFLKSALQGDVGAMYFIGTLLKEGKGVDQNLDQAGEWFLKAALKDYPDAQIEIGEMYVSGNGRHKDLVEAYCWFKLAAANGIQSGITKSQLVATILPQEDFKKAQEKASRLWKKLQKLDY